VGNQREIRQVSPREGRGVVIPIQVGHSGEVRRLLGDVNQQCRFYTCFRPAGEPIEFPNMDGPAVVLGSQSRDHAVIQSGGKMWCGYEAFVDHVRALATHLDDATFSSGTRKTISTSFSCLAVNYTTVASMRAAGGPLMNSYGHGTQIADNSDD
jgi:hypothetical protein